MRMLADVTMTGGWFMLPFLVLLVVACVSMWWESRS